MYDNRTSGPKPKSRRASKILIAFGVLLGLGLALFGHLAWRAVDGITEIAPGSVEAYLYLKPALRNAPVLLACTPPRYAAYGRDGDRPAYSSMHYASKADEQELADAYHNYFADLGCSLQETPDPTALLQVAALCPGPILSRVEVAIETGQTDCRGVEAHFLERN